MIPSRFAARSISRKEKEIADHRIKTWDHTGHGLKSQRRPADALSEIYGASGDKARPLKIVIPPRAGHFSILRLLASLQRRNSRFALKPSSLRALKPRGQGAPKNLQCAL
jgi:hypothetical protein